jgi:hypothetical protein
LSDKFYIVIYELCCFAFHFLFLSFEEFLPFGNFQINTLWVSALLVLNLKICWKKLKSQISKSSTHSQSLENAHKFRSKRQQKFLFFQSKILQVFFFLRRIEGKLCGDASHKAPVWKVISEKLNEKEKAKLNRRPTERSRSVKRKKIEFQFRFIAKGPLRKSLAMKVFITFRALH